MSKKILILTAPIGMGHVKVAEALKEKFNLKLQDVEVEIVDIFNFFPAFLGKIILNGYAMILKYCPELYGRMYQASNNRNQLVFFKNSINRFLAKRIYKFIFNYNPDIIISTHATPGGLIAYLKKEDLVKTPSFAVVTDFVVHKFWVYKELDGYF
ncbi:galactosyldiacylglycerol synthase, partial [Selenomonadales bacterium OttesenSCG-928-I06]|nr:galactosyldiacylglycerol synthase [Selenomonadales bacterium OttesenSCG-928-I06]